MFPRFYLKFDKVISDCYINYKIHLIYPVLILERYMCPDGVRIVGRWCYKPCTEAKETLDYVPI